MKKLFILLITLMLAVGAVGCGSPAANPTPTPTQEIDPYATTRPSDLPTAVVPDNPPSAVNPLVEVESNVELSEQLDVILIAPEEAQNVQYAIINDKIGQVEFSFEGDLYTARAAKVNEDISGVYVVFETQKDMLYVDYPYQIKYNEGGEGLSMWYDELTECTYSVYILSGATEEKLQRMTEVIAPVS